MCCELKNKVTCFLSRWSLWYTIFFVFVLIGNFLNYWNLCFCWLFCYEQGTWFLQKSILDVLMSGTSVFALILTGSIISLIVQYTNLLNWEFAGSKPMCHLIAYMYINHTRCLLKSQFQFLAFNVFSLFKCARVTLCKTRGLLWFDRSASSSQYSSTFIFVYLVQVVFDSIWTVFDDIMCWVDRMCTVLFYV